MRAATARVSGFTSAAIWSTVPGDATPGMPLSTCAGSPTRIVASSAADTCAITHTFDRSATVKHGVVPACSSCPGVISFSTTVPAIGARMMPCARATGRPARIALSVPASTSSATSACSAASRSASALAASVCACSASRRDTPSCCTRSLSASASRRAFRAPIKALRYALIAAEKSAESTSASG